MIRILQVTDPHILPTPDQRLVGVQTESYFKQVLEYAFRHHGPFEQILLTGDLAQDPCLESYRRIVDLIETYNTPSLALPGNHDDFDLMAQVFNREQIGCDKIKRIGNWLILCLNSQKQGYPGGWISDQELDFLDRQLQQHPDHYVLIATHHHCISSDSVWMDTMMIENSDALFAVLSGYTQVKAIVFGHVHQQLDKHRQGIALFGSPASCFQFKPGCREFALDDKPPGFRVLELHDDGIIRTQVHWLPIALEELERQSAGY